MVIVAVVTTVRRKTLTQESVKGSVTNLKANKKVIRETSDNHPPVEMNCLYMVALT